MRLAATVALVGAMLLTRCAKRVTTAHGVAPVSPSARSAVAENMRRQVRNAVDAGDGDVRVRALRQRLAGFPDDLPARLEIARYYASAGFQDVALEHYRIAASRFPESAEVAVDLARTLWALGFPAEGARALRAFVASQKQGTWEPLSWLAVIEDALREHASAEAHHRAAIALNGRSAALHNNLGYNLLLQGKPADAAPEFRRALEIDPKSTLARNNLGIALAGQPGEAVHQWQAGTDPATAHNNLAAILIEKGDYQQARRELETALTYRKDHPAALRNLQLVAELDGGSVRLPNGETATSWHRYLRSIAVFLFGEPQQDKKGAVRPARTGD